MKFLAFNLLLSFLLLTSTIVTSKDKSKTSFDNYGDLNAEFTFIEIDNPSLPQAAEIGFALEKNSIIVEPYIIKLIYTPLQKYHFIKMSDIVIFNNFEILFDMNLMSKNIFGILDKKRSLKVNQILEKLKLRFGQASENCRFIFSNNIETMLNINLATTSVNTLSQMNNINPYLSLTMNVFCFTTMDGSITFHSNLMKMFNNFIGSVTANHLFYFNKLKMNNLRIMYRNMRMNTATNTAGVTVDNNYGLNQRNPYSNLSTLNIQYAYLIFSEDGVLFSDGPSNNVKNVIYSFGYDSIKDCLIQMVPKNLVLPHKISLTETNKCCIKMQIDVKDVYDNQVNICSYKTSLYQCNLEAKYIQEALMNKCAKKLLFNIGYAFDNNFNIREYIMTFSSFSQEFIFKKVYEYIVEKLKYSKIVGKEKQMAIETKLTRMMQELGQDFQKFLKENSNLELADLIANVRVGMPMIGEANIIASEDPFALPLNTDRHHNNNLFPHPMAPTNNGGVILEDTPHTNLDHNLNPPPIPFPLPHDTNSLGLSPVIHADKSLFNNNPVPKANIFQLCESHPKMKDCICAAFPLSHICKNDFCINHPHYYECSPKYCTANPTDNEACKCKFTPYDTECKCRLNPLRKECYCMKYPNSAFCLADFCSDSKNNNQIYCLCKKNPFAADCKPAYCHDNKYDSRCRCLIAPWEKSCKCMTNPRLNGCGNGSYSSGKDYEVGVELLKKYKNNENDSNFENKSESRRENRNEEVDRSRDMNYNQISHVSKNVNNFNTVDDEVYQRNENLAPLPHLFQNNNRSSNSNSNRNNNRNSNSNSNKNTNSNRNNNNNNNNRNSNSNRNNNCSENDTFCLCKNQANYKQCVCLAHPSANICREDYCEKNCNKNKYECNPLKNCNQGNEDQKSCKCKFNFNSDCKCKLNPNSKACFCEKFKLSHLCNESNCNFEKNSLFCKCKKEDDNIMSNSECSRNFCVNNPNSAKCECIMNPSEGYCKCLNDPSKCSKSEIMKSIQEYKQKIISKKSNVEREEHTLTKIRSNEIEEYQIKNKSNSNNKRRRIDMSKQTTINDMPKSNSKNYSNIKKNSNSADAEEEYKYIMSLYNKQLLFNKRMKPVANNIKFS